MLGVQHVTVLDEQQRLDYERRNAGVARIDSCGAIEGIHIVAVSIYDPQSGLVLLAIDRIESDARQRCEHFRTVGLCLDLIAAGFQAAEKGGNARIAERPIVRTRRRIVDGRALPFRKAVREMAVCFAKDGRFQPGVLQLKGYGCDNYYARHHRDSDPLRRFVV